jgi:hypothetical protein
VPEYFLNCTWAIVLYIPAGEKGKNGREHFDPQELMVNGAGIPRSYFKNG